jgi:transcriptional regulator with XRE-family HTH domain
MPARGIKDEYELRRKMELKRKGVTQSDLAKEWNTSQPFVSRLLSGDFRSHQYEEALAKKLGMDVTKLFAPLQFRDLEDASMKVQ